MKGVPIDESLCAYLKEYRRGQENAASSKELEAAFHVGRDGAAAGGQPPAL